MWYKLTMQRLYLEFGRLLREQRIGHSLNQQAVAERVGLSRTSITNIELGKQHITLHMLYELASAVNTTPEQLLPDKKFVGHDSIRLSEAIEQLPIDDNHKDWIQRIAAKHESIDGGTKDEARGSRRTRTK